MSVNATLRAEGYSCMYHLNVEINRVCRKILVSCELETLKYTVETTKNERLAVNASI